MLVRHADGSVEELLLNHTFNANQIAWFRAGSALNLIAERGRGRAAAGAGKTGRARKSGKKPARRKSAKSAKAAKPRRSSVQEKKPVSARRPKGGKPPKTGPTRGVRRSGNSRGKK